MCRTFSQNLFRVIAIIALTIPMFAGAVGNEIIIGQVIDLSSPNAAIGRDYVAGIRTYVDNINTTGGINGHKINYIVKDDQAQPAIAVKEASELIERDHVEYLIGGVGDAVTKAVLASPAFKRSGLILYAPLASINQEDGANILYWRPNYDKEIQLLLTHFASIGLKDAGIFYQELPTNREAYGDLVKELQARGFKLSGTAKVGMNGENIVAETVRLKSTKPKFVLVVADTIGTALFLKEFRKLDQTTFVVGTSLTHFATLREMVGPTALDWTVFSQVVPNPNASTTFLQMEHAKMMKKFRDEAVSSLTLEGFAAAKALVKTIEVAKNTHAALQEMRSKSREIDLGGLWIVSSPKDSHQSNFLDIALFRKGTGMVF
jgi:ABC-type branched-subunit amino acid transport system substrate-binding protein